MTLPEQEQITQSGDRVSVKERLIALLTMATVGVAACTLAYSEGVEEGKEKFKNDSHAVLWEAQGLENEMNSEDYERKIKALAEVQRMLDNNEPLPVYVGLTNYDEEPVPRPQAPPQKTTSTTGTKSPLAPDTTFPPKAPMPPVEHGPATTVGAPELGSPVPTTRLTPSTIPGPGARRPITMPDPIVIKFGEFESVYVTFDEGELQARSRDDFVSPGTLKGRDAGVRMISDYRMEDGGLVTADGRPFAQILEGEPIRWPEPPAV